VRVQRRGKTAAKRNYPVEWSEFDLDSDTPTWTIPRSRMKMKESTRPPHLVPIPAALLALLKMWKAEDGEGAVYVCPAPRSKGHITADALEKFYRRTLGLKGKHVPHSWRRVWKTWGGNAGKPFDQLEAQLDLTPWEREDRLQAAIRPRRGCETHPFSTRQDARCGFRMWLYIVASNALTTFWQGSPG
jgi:integrase